MTSTDTQTTAPTEPQSRNRTLVILAPLAIFAALAVMFGYALTLGDPSRVPSTLIGKPAPETALPAMDGLTSTDGTPIPGFSTADLKRGDVTVVNFFASWCVDCVQEHAMLLRLTKEAGVKVYGVDYKDPRPGGRRFLGRFGNPYAALGMDDSGRTGIEWGVYGMPETFIIDGDGHILLKQIGGITETALLTKIIPTISTARARIANAHRNGG